MTLWLQFARLELMLGIFKIKLHNFSYLILSFRNWYFSLSSEYTFLNRHQTSVLGGHTDLRLPNSNQTDRAASMHASQHVRAVKLTSFDFPFSVHIFIDFSVTGHGTLNKQE